MNAAVLKWLVVYLATGVAFVVMDAAWLTFAGPRLYKPALSSLLTDQVRLAPAVAFYLLYVFGLVMFCVRPGPGRDWRVNLAYGALFGLVAYGAYDLTCQAVMRVWSTRVSLGDMAWGAVASGLATLAGIAATTFTQKWG